MVSRFFVGFVPLFRSLMLTPMWPGILFWTDSRTASSAPLTRGRCDNAANVLGDLVDVHVVVWFVENGHETVVENGKRRPLGWKVIPAVLHNGVPAV